MVDTGISFGDQLLVSRWSWKLKESPPQQEKFYILRVKKCHLNPLFSCCFLTEPLPQTSRPLGGGFSHHKAASSTGRFGRHQAQAAGSGGVPEQCGLSSCLGHHLYDLVLDQSAIPSFEIYRIVLNIPYFAPPSKASI